MKIAKAILDEMDTRFMLDIYPQEWDEAESVIATKLEPMEDALGWALAYLEMFCGEDHRTEFWEMRMADGKKVLTLFEEKRHENENATAN